MNVKVTLALHMQLNNGELYKDVVYVYVDIFIMACVGFSNLCISHSYYAKRYSRDAIIFRHGN